MTPTGQIIFTAIVVSTCMIGVLGLPSMVGYAAWLELDKRKQKEMGR